MSDMMKIQPFDVLLNWILKEYQTRQSIFGIHRSLFYTPKSDTPYTTPDMFGHFLGTPIGPAAGPHTQLAQNIICAWLSGGRFIELKTVQIMDELEIPRPCIDMEDEGYNVEWSQELKLHESVDEYIKAWALIHILPHMLGFDLQIPFDTIFNMSVGYNLEGIQSPPMTHFMDQLADASELIARIREILGKSFPQFANIEISPRITNSVTLSTMHGCPPDEIERIARYMLEERGLHTTVKLNPTLLGKDRVLNILHDTLGYIEMQIPDSAFEHDLKYTRAIELIAALKQAASKLNLSFGVKLSNTLAMQNHKTSLPSQEMYMSGRALYPLSISLFNQLAREFNGALNVSFSAGADALNVTDILSCGALPVTVATDFLKPGGYSRCLQYLENLEKAMLERGAKSLDDLTRNKLENLQKMASDALTNPRYKKTYHSPQLPKVNSPLGLFDCIIAPCAAQCPVNQDVPEYAWLIAHGEYNRALEVILARNPLPGITGYVCTHTCQDRCTRIDYDEPVAIRALKRVAFEKGRAAFSRPTGQTSPTSPTVAIIGAGPSGLAAASTLALNGIRVTIFEARDKVGGMTDIAPVFRLPRSVIQEDVDRIVSLGVEIKLKHPITTPPEELLKQGFDAVYVACGMPKDAPLNIEGIKSRGVYSALELLDKAARGKKLDLGSKVLVIGGGNTAVDAARTAQRLTGKPVTIIYRRTQHEMPADEEEREDLLAEGNVIEELVSPVRVLVKNRHVIALECVRNKLGEPGPDGRRKPIHVKESNFQIKADAIIIAIGQSPDITFFNGSSIMLHKHDGSTSGGMPGRAHVPVGNSGSAYVPVGNLGGSVSPPAGAIFVDPQTQQAGQRRVYAGGDAVRGPSTIIQACADGQQAAKAILKELNIADCELRIADFTTGLSEEEITQVKRTRARKEALHKPEMLPLSQRSGFDLVEQTLTTEAARVEALRCLQCSSFCDKCVEVCPNRANLTYFIEPLNLNLPRLSCKDGKVLVTGHDTFILSQSRQILHLDDLCNECGNCETFCVHKGKPYRDKPRLFFKKRDFEQESDNAFYIEPIPDPSFHSALGTQHSATPDPSVQSAIRNPQSAIGWHLCRLNNSPVTQLSLPTNADKLTFENAWLRGSVSLPDFQLNLVELKQPFDGEYSLVDLAEMFVVLKGVLSSSPFLPIK